jgi:DNA-binding NtrC family response regulator
MLTILLVDDDAMVLGFCHAVLARISGTHILRATSGREALERAMAHPCLIDLLISDICMPGELDGVELAERLEEVQPNLSVLLISGCDPDEFNLSGSWGFLAKPFLPDALICKVEEVLNRATRPVAP